MTATRVESSSLAEDGVARSARCMGLSHSIMPSKVGAPVRVCMACALCCFQDKWVRSGTRVRFREVDGVPAWAGFGSTPNSHMYTQLVLYFNMYL